MYRTRGIPEFDDYYEALSRQALEGNGEATYLAKIIGKGIEKLRFDFKYGDHIPRNRIPREYFDKYQANNLWKLNLDSNWRLIYTVRGTKEDVMSLLIEVLDHKAYDRKFGYHTS